MPCDTSDWAEGSGRGVKGECGTKRRYGASKVASLLANRRFVQFPPSARCPLPSALCPLPSTRMTEVDLLAIAAHRDDVELTCAGTLIKAARQGYRTAILDLTQGEMGTRGSAATRADEAS